VSHYWILISGKQGSGKSTTARELKTQLSRYGYRIAQVSLADPIRQAANQAMLSLNSVPTADQYGRLLQLLGQWGREVDENFWVDRLRHKISTTEFHPDTFFICDDVRFLNELENLPNVEDRKLRIRLYCPEVVRQQRAEKWRPTAHESEIALDQAPLGTWDLILGTDITPLPDVIRQILERISLVKRIPEAQDSL